MIELFHNTSEQCSKAATLTYSTSFGSAIKLLHKNLRSPIFNIYGFVRFADEIVDTFHQYNKHELLANFKAETFDSIKRGISLNPILNSFQLTVNKYNIEPELIEAFFKSMELDLNKKQYSIEGYQEYIYGSAEVVGLMCLHVFCEKNKELYNELKPSAKSLGAAFQKVNFLRDVKSDYEQLNRTYFPEVDFKNFSVKQKLEIEADITKDFAAAKMGIAKLPAGAKIGVYTAYRYYLSLFKKIQRTSHSKILQSRIRIPNYSKAVILAKAQLRTHLNLL